MTLERDDEAEAFLEQHPGAEGNVGFTRALIAFRREGDTPTSRHWLKIGDEQNRFIAPWMLGDDPFPAEDPQSYSHGSPEEARIHVRSMRCAWRSTPGAIAWMRRTLASLGGSSGSATGTFRPAAADRSRLARLPMSYETWQAGFRQIPTRLKAGDDLVIPWVILVNSRTSGQVIESAMLEEAPRASQVWDAIDKALERPLGEDSRRPSVLEVQPDPRWDQLRPYLEEVGIALQECDALEPLDEMFEDLIQHLLRDEPPGLLDVPRVTPETVGSVFSAAADFYRKAPWRTLGDRRGIRVECPRFQSGPWAAVVMGQAGMTLGLAIYERLDHLRALWRREPDPNDELVRRITSLAVTFDRESLARPKDAFAAAKYGWEVADPEAFPDIDRKEPGMRIRPPLSWELILLEGCLRAIPAFLVRYAPATRPGAR